MEVKIGSTTLARVKSVQPSRDLAKDAFVSSAGAGAEFRTVEIRGYIFGSAEGMLTEHVTFENTLAALGDTTLTLGNLTPIPGRVSKVQWEPYSTGPIWFYTITFTTKSQANPFAGVVSVGAVTLNNPTPNVTEQYRVVSDDDAMDKTHSRAFRLQGRYSDSPSNVQTFMASLEAALASGASNGYFTLVTPMGSFTARARDFEIRRPEETEAQQTVTYYANLETRADYSLEQFNLPHQQISVGGITWDVLNSFSHNIERIQKASTTVFKIKTESMTWSVKKYFSSVASADAYKPNFDALVNQRHTMASPTGQLLECKSVSYNVVTRDGYDTLGNRRYSITVSITFSKPTAPRDPAGGTVFGVLFESITSDSRGVTVDDNGGIKSRSRNVSGKVASLPADSILGAIANEADGNYYVVGYNIGTQDEDGLWEVSLSGRTLESESQCFSLWDEFFEGIHFAEVTSKNRNVSMSESNVNKGNYEATGLTDSISGYVVAADANGILNLVTINGIGSGGQKITSASVGAREPYTIPGTRECTYRQSVTLSRNVTYKQQDAPSDGSGGQDQNKTGDPDQPDVKEETSTSISQQTDRFSVITIPGGDIVYKKVGIEPARARVRVSRTAKNFHVFNSMGAPGKPGAPGIPNPIETEDTTEEQGLTKSRTVAWMAGSPS